MIADHRAGPRAAATTGRERARSEREVPSPEATDAVSASVASAEYATLAQLVEQCFRKAEVPGSIPGGGSTRKIPTSVGIFLWIMDVARRRRNG